MTLGNYQIDISCFTMCLTTLNNRWVTGNVLVDIYVSTLTCIYFIYIYLYTNTHRKNRDSAHVLE